MPVQPTEPADSNDPLDVVIGYHQRTKHRPRRYARSLGYMDWETRPDPFRRYVGANLTSLDVVPPTPEPALDAVAERASVPSRSLDRAFVSQLFFDSLALSAWKVAGHSRWSLRCNPSSGNLHPTEGYLVAPAVVDLTDAPGVFHYRPYDHAFEQRRCLDDATWRTIAAGLPAPVVLVGLTSIHWRESWKYGERAYRYCQHDAGHAIAAVAYAAAAMGWRARILDGAGDAAIAALLGIARQRGIEAEHPDALLALWPAISEAEAVRAVERWRPPPELLALADVPAIGEPAALSHDHHEWPIIDAVAEACRRPSPADDDDVASASPPSPLPALESRAVSAREMFRQRRSAAEMDGKTMLDADLFWRIVRRVQPGAGVPFDSLPWLPVVHPVWFVHRVREVEPGLYLQVRDPAALPRLRAAIGNDELAWSRPRGCPAELDVFLLAAKDVRAAARFVACEQAIASDGVFAMGMLAEFEPALTKHGPWFYRRIHWEAGALGQVLYLEAEAAGVRGTGIGCFFDDVMHDSLGLAGRDFQTVYHFTVGAPSTTHGCRPSRPTVTCLGERGSAGQRFGRAWPARWAGVGRGWRGG